jgi:multimeric flavodoxin WrbA
MTEYDRAETRVRTGQGPEKLDKTSFARRFRARFFDPAFDPQSAAIEALLDIAWTAYQDSRKSPRTQKAGDEFEDPDYDLATDWLETRDAIRAARARYADPASPRRILLVIGSPRNDKTCPGEISKSFRLAEVARATVEDAGVECDVLDLSLTTSEYGRTIHPCKACVSTAMPLCHWPCSCYPNHSLGQTNDWMNELYPRWVAAHGVLIVTPTHWLQAPAALKLMIDRLVCADGGNPDPTTTQGKDAALAKRIELEGWDYPRYLEGRAFALVVHGDTEGVRALRRSLVDWLSAMSLVQAGNHGVLDRYIGYYESYASSHEALDRDQALVEEVRNAARSLLDAVRTARPQVAEPGGELRDPRPK